MQYLLMTASKLNKQAEQEWGEPKYLYLHSVHTVWNYRTSMNHCSGMEYALWFAFCPLHTESLSEKTKEFVRKVFIFVIRKWNMTVIVTAVVALGRDDTVGV
jgi:hypothetical protein